MLRAFENRSQLRQPEAGRSWFLRILIRTHLNRVRGERRRRESVESDLSEGRFESALAEWSRERTRDDWLERLADRDRVRRAIGEIDPRFRIVLLLFVLMPPLLGMPAFARLQMPEMRGVAMGSLVSHLIYGLVLGAAYVKLVTRPAAAAATRPLKA